jgi:hypothetical protein
MKTGLGLFTGRRKSSSNALEELTAEAAPSPDGHASANADSGGFRVMSKNEVVRPPSAGKQWSARNRRPSSLASAASVHLAIRAGFSHSRKIRRGARSGKHYGPSDGRSRLINLKLGIASLATGPSSRPRAPTTTPSMVPRPRCHPPPTPARTTTSSPLFLAPTYHSTTARPALH